MSDQRHAVWRKQVLALGNVEWRGRTLSFTREYLAGLVSAFDARAFDFVPFQLAADVGYASLDPTLNAGEVIGLEVVPEGLDALIAVSSAFAAEPPALDVAVRIIEQFACPDGRVFPAVISLVYGTGRSIMNLRPWRLERAASGT
jgi:hypothetical protein